MGMLAQLPACVLYRSLQLDNSLLNGCFCWALHALE